MSEQINDKELKSKEAGEMYLPGKAILRGIPTPPRKMRLVVDNIRGMEVERALATLHYSPRLASGRRIEKLLRSAIANWEQINERQAEQGELYVKTVFVDEGSTIKRLRPAPQGRGYRIRKRSNHVTILVNTLSSK